VDLVDPFSGEVFQFPATIKMVASASDFDGIVKKVEFWADGVKVGEQTDRDPAWGSLDIEPRAFSFTWTGAQTGRHLLKAVAFDDRGATAQSSAVSILVITGALPPLVSVSTTDATAAERTGHKHANTATFKVQRTGKLDHPLTVFYSMKGTATNGKDYLELPGKITIPARKRNARVTVVPVNDTEPEPVETVILQLEPAPSGLSADLYQLDWRNAASALIIDDDRSKSEQPRLPKNVFHFSLPGEDGTSYRVEVSEDLIRWVTISDTIAEDEQVQFLDSEMRGFKHRFFRVRPIGMAELDDDD